MINLKLPALEYIPFHPKSHHHQVSLLHCRHHKQQTLISAPSQSSNPSKWVSKNLDSENSLLDLTDQTMCKKIITLYKVTLYDDFTKYITGHLIEMVLSAEQKTHRFTMPSNTTNVAKCTPENKVFLFIDCISFSKTP